ncbi:MAG TPA: fatty acid--CoA ligase, partial [Candidatus Angelobacter sp.]|nr:fatty acid--CoA ligase [Candidatus Angelobacter sp.]
MPSQNTIHTMMDYPLTLTALLERAGRYAAGVEIVSRLPNRTMHRYTWGHLHQRALRLAECLQSIGLK